jgi:hypothetical protein
MNLKEKVSIKKALDLFLFCVAFLLCLEVAARVDDKIQYSAPFLDRYSADRLRTNDSGGFKRNFPGRQFEKWRINQSGFRGPEISIKKTDGVKRIICLGSSETFGLYESPGKEWPAQLGTMLKSQGQFEVINASVAGLTLKNYLLYFEKYVLKFEPDVVILFVNPFYYGAEEKEGRVGVAVGAGRA